MRGHVRKRGTTWAVVIDIGRDAATGKRRQKWHSGYRTRKEAERALTDILTRLERGSYVNPSRQSLAAFLEEWLPASQIELRESTYESYARNVRVHIVPRLGGVELQRLNAMSLNAFYADLLRCGRADGTGGLASRTVRYIHTILHSALADAVRWNLLSRNPADQATPPSARAAQSPEMRAWTAEQLRAFLTHVGEHRMYAAFLLAGTTGMRRGEVAGLKWADIDFERSRLAVRRALVTIGYEVAWSEPKTDRGRRSVALDHHTVAALRAHRARQAQERLALGPAYSDEDLVFAREDGSAPHPERLSKVFAGEARKAGLGVIRFHDLRHTYATIALQAGVHIKVVSERLGHSDIALTLNIYSHAIPALEEAAADRVADVIFGTA